MVTKAMDLYKLPPPPLTLEDCHKEILYLQQEVYKARDNFARLAVTHEKQRKAIISASIGTECELADYRQSIAELNAQLDEMTANVSAWLEKDVYSQAGLCPDDLTCNYECGFSDCRAVKEWLAAQRGSENIKETVALLLKQNPPHI